MAKKQKHLLPTGPETAGQRLARLRAEAGYTQRALAAEIGVSHRMVAYYETETAFPPAHWLARLTKVLGVSADSLLGLENGNGKEKRTARDNRLWRRFAKIEKMSAREKRQIIQILDAFIEREQLKQKAVAA